MRTIGELLSRDLGRPIEEIIKVDQDDEQSVYDEITDYIATDRIKDQYQGLFRAIADAPSEPTEGVGVWISGFFGSGKSSFAKNLGYVLANRSVLGKSTSELFKEQVDSKSIQDLVDFINQQIPTEVIMFDVSVDRAVKRTNERIAEVMYTVLLRELGYAEDYDIADLEIELEREEKLEEFINHCREKYGNEWRVIRKGAQKISRASAILYELDPATYPAADSWSQSLRDKSADITVGQFVERAFDLCSRRRPGKALVFIIDEVGQYVARSADKIEDLRAVIEQFGKTGKNLLKAKQVPAPAWIIVTSQEKLDEVVAAIDDKRVELAKLQDRFKHRIDMAPADIREVATRRILAKNDDGNSTLRQQFQESGGLLNTACRLERTTRKSEISSDDFVQFYPYLPHFIELSIQIMSGIRLQPGAPRHYGGSNRTIIKQAYEMLVSERTALATQPVGTLVTLDKIYELVEGNLSTEKRNDIDEITQRFKDDPDDRGMAARVAKAVCLLEFVRDLPRTETNIAACLVDAVGRPSPRQEVEQALQKLYNAKFVRNTEEGWKLQTAQEKNWETERRAISPRQRDRNEILRDTLKEVFSDPKIKVYRFKDLKSFRVGIQVDGNTVGEDGQIPLALCTVAEEQEFADKLAEVRGDSRQESNKDQIYWVFSLTPEIDDLVVNLHASNQMVAKYDQMRGQNKITPEEAICLQDEKNEVNRLKNRLKDRVSEALQAGTSMFQGIEKSGADLGKTLGEIFKGLFDSAVPKLYSRLEIGARPLKGTEAEEILKAANLNALSLVFYEGEQGLGLVLKEGAKSVPNPNAEIAKEVLSYLQLEHSYGNKVTGKTLEERFQGTPYGWDRDILRLVLAVLLRAGTIEVTYQGRRFRNHIDAQCRVPFVNNTAFKAASFAPHESIALKTLITAVQAYEELTGEEVDVEEGAIAVALKKFAEAELKLVLPAIATSRANQLPITDFLEDYQHTLTGIQSAASDDCVRTLAGEGNALQEASAEIRKMQGILDREGLAKVQQARLAVNNVANALLNRPEATVLESQIEELHGLLDDRHCYDHLTRIAALTQEILSAYRAVYTQLHDQRHHDFIRAIDDLKGQPEWLEIPEDISKTLLSPLKFRACEEKDYFQDAKTTCQVCNATLNQMDSDLLAAQGLKTQLLARIQELIAPPDDDKSRVERVQLSQFFNSDLTSTEAIDEAVEQLKEYLYSLLEKGIKVIVE